MRSKLLIKLPGLVSFDLLSFVENTKCNLKSMKINRLTTKFYIFRKRVNNNVNVGPLYTLMVTEFNT